MSPTGQRPSTEERTTAFETPRVGYSIGDHASCVSSHVAALVGRPPTDPMTLAVWGVLGRTSDADEVVGALLAQGMGAAPSFAVVVSSAGRECRIIVRGSVTVIGVDTDGEFTTHARGILHDETRVGVQWCLIKTDGTEPDPVLPLIAGVVPASGIRLSWGDDQADAPPVSTAAPATTDGEPPLAEEPQADPVDLVPDLSPAAASVSDLPADPAPSEPVEKAPAPLDAPLDLPVSSAYEFLFADPPDADVTEGAAPSAPVEAVEPEPEPVPVQPVEQPVAVVHDTPAVAPYAAEPAPEPSDGFIDAVPGFFGPVVGESVVAPTNPVPPSPIAAPAMAFPEPTWPAPPWEPEIASSASASSAPMSGRTVNRASFRSPARPGPTVWAAYCPTGHPSQAHASRCRICGQAMPPDPVPVEIPRPVLGRLVLPVGDPVVLDGDLVLGRDPRVPLGADPTPRLVVLNDPRMEVSSQHAAISLNFWDVCLTDLGSTNGTEIVTPDGRRQRLAPDVPVTIAPGTKIVFAEVFEVTFEASG